MAADGAPVRHGGGAGAHLAAGQVRGRTVTAAPPCDGASGGGDTGAQKLAEALLEEHGADAPIIAARRISERLRVGDEAALAAWRRVLSTIYKLQAEKR